MTGEVLTEARGILRELREAATAGPWVRFTGGYGYDLEDADVGVLDQQAYDGFRPIRSNGQYAETDGAMSSADATLIVLLAGNPALLDALDGMLGRRKPKNPFTYDPWDDESVDPTNTDEVIDAAVSRGWDAGAYEMAERIASAIVTQWKAMQG